MTKTPEELTSDWKTGKLKAGSYYVQYADDEIDIERASEWFKSGRISCGINFDDPVCVYKVLAPVPAYDEYKAMQAKIDRLRAAFNDILKDTPSCFNNRCPLNCEETDCHEYERCFVVKAKRALNGESEE